MEIVTCRRISGGENQSFGLSFPPKTPLVHPLLYHYLVLCLVVLPVPQRALLQTLTPPCL